MSRRSASLPVRLLVAFAFVAALVPVVPLPATVVAADFSNAAGRLVVIWRVRAPAILSVADVTRNARSANGRRSVVVAAAGQTDAVIARLRTDPRIAAIIPDSRVTVGSWPTSGTPDDAYFAGYQPDLPLIGLPTAWQTTTGASSVIVAVLDTGMTRTHLDLDAVSVVAPRNEIADTTDVTDGNGHGTHVIGTIAAETNNGIGVAGIAPGVSIMPIKVLDDAGSGWLSDIIDGIDYARTNGAGIISMSLGGSLDPASVAVYQPTFDAAYAAGITMVAAAGNSGTSAISYPGGFNHVLAIGATDNGDAHASFSQTNASVALSAPGVTTLSTSRDGGYAIMSGTSMATPHVAGVAALIRSARPTDSVDQVEQALLSTAVDLGAPGRDDVFGYGRINAAAAVAYVAAPGPAPTPAPTASPAPTPAPTASPTASPSPAPTASPTASPSPAPTASPAPAPTPAPTASPSPLPSPTPSPSLSPLPSPTPSPSPTPTLDTSRPTVVGKTPASGKTGVDRDRVIRIRFSEPVRGVSRTTVRLVRVSTGRVVRATVRYDSLTNTAIIDPTSRAYAWTSYRVEVRAGITDRSGNRAATTSWRFKTGAR